MISVIRRALAARQARQRSWESERDEARRAQAGAEARVKAEQAELERRRAQLDAERVRLAEEQSRFEVRTALLEPQLRELESAQLLLESKQRELGASAQRTDSEARRLQELVVDLRQREHAVEAALLDVTAQRDGAETSARHAARDLEQIAARGKELERSQVSLHRQQLEISQQAMALRRALGILRRNGHLEEALSTCEKFLDEVPSTAPPPPAIPDRTAGIVMDTRAGWPAPAASLQAPTSLALPPTPPMMPPWLPGGAAESQAFARPQRDRPSSAPAQPDVLRGGFLQAARALTGP